MQQKFHLSLACKSKKVTKNFYKKTLGLSIGRQGENWFDVNMYGNQLTFKEVPNFKLSSQSYKLQEHELPVFHFGIILDFSTWNGIYEDLYYNGIEVSVEKEFFIDNNGEHTSFFIKDPNGYSIEFKYFKYENEVFTPFLKDELHC